MTTPDVIYADKHDNVIGSGSIGYAVEQGIIRRVVQIFLIDGAGSLLLQRRSAHSYAFPLRWNASATGHVDVGETYEEAAYREMKEEIDVDDVALKEVGKIFIEEDEEGYLKSFAMLYVGTSAKRQTVPDYHEVSEMRWFPIVDIVKWIERTPDDFTPSFGGGLEFFLARQSSGV